MSPDKDVEFMMAAYLYAEQFSTDPSTQNGAVLVKGSPFVNSEKIVASGANHFPHGVEESEERWVRPLKYSYVEHAERNAIFDAARRGVRTRGLIMYCPWVACADCARAIIQAGIIEVVGHKPAPESMAHIEAPNGSWDASIAVGMGMFDEAGVKVRYLEGKLDPDNTLSIRRNGKIYHP